MDKEMLDDIYFRLDAIEQSIEELLTFVQQIHLSHSTLMESYEHLLASHGELLEMTEKHIRGY